MAFQPEGSPWYDASPARSVAVAAEKFGYHFGLAFQVIVCPHTLSLRPEPARLTPRVRPRASVRPR